MMTGGWILTALSALTLGVGVSKDRRRRPNLGIELGDLAGSDEISIAATALLMPCERPLNLNARRRLSMWGLEAL
jgi:hypothetical protein